MTIKLNAATGGGSVSLSAPNSTTSNLDVELTLPVDDGAANTFLKSDGAGTLSWASASSDSITEGNTTVECVDTGSDGHITFDTEGSEAMRINSSQNVGIGTNNPGYKLEVKSGTAQYAFTNNGSNPRLGFFYNNTPENTEIHSYSTNFYTGGSTTFDGTKKVSIGNAGRLQVQGSDGVMFAVATTGSAGTSNYLIDAGYGAGNFGAYTASFRVYTNGNVQNTNNSYGALSDQKLKESIVDASSQWNDLKAIQVRNYNFKEDTGYQTHTQIGVIAQEVELISPGLVTETPDRDDDGNDLGTTTKSVNYSVLYMKSVKALQEAMERIETLETANASLEARLTALEGGAS